MGVGGMENLNQTFVIATALLLASILLPARLIAMKLNRDPISKRYKPDTPEYKAYVKFRADSHKFNISLVGSVLVTLLLAVYVIREAGILAHSNTTSARQTLIFAPIASIFLLIVAIVIIYNLFLKKSN